MGSRWLEHDEGYLFASFGEEEDVDISLHALTGIRSSGRCNFTSSSKGGIAGLGGFKIDSKIHVRGGS